MLIITLLLVTFIILISVIMPIETQNNLIPIKQINRIITSMLSQYPDYDIIFHLDNTTKNDFDMFLDINLHFQTILLLNYSTDTIFGRPLGYKFLHIVFLINISQFSKFSKRFFNIEFNDIILIVTRGVSKFLNQKGLDRAGSVFVFDLFTNNLHYECFYCGNTTGILRIISSNKPVTSVRNYLNNFTNFHGHYFKIGYMSYFPFFWHEDSQEGVNIVGPEGKLLRVLSKTLNFRYSLEDFQDYVGGEWKAMVNAVHLRKLDWAVGGISSSPERGELADLTKYIHIETYTALFCCCSSNSTWRSWHQILLPFKLSLWLSILSSLIIMTFVLKKASDCVTNNSSANIFKYFEIAVRGVIDQPIHRLLAKEMAKRFLLIAWWYVAIILTTAYRSKLASSLIHPYYNQPNSVQELLLEGYIFQVSNEDWSVLQENLHASIDHTYKTVLKKANDNLDICSSIQQTIQNKIAVIDEATTLHYEAFANCRSRIKSQDFLHLRVIGEQLFPSYHVWPMQLAAPYRRSFSKTIENLHSSGILNRWYDLASKKHLPTSNHYTEVDSFTALTTSTMFAPISILLVGLLLAVIVFTCELIYFTLNRLINFYNINNIHSRYN